jgi:transposase
MLTAAYFMLRDVAPYRDLGPQHIDQRQRDSTIRRLMRKLHDLGCKVSVIAPRTAPKELGVAS